MTCPECRAEVTRAPAPSFVIKEFVDFVIDRTEMISPDEYKEHKKFALEDADFVRAHRENEDPQEGGLFKGVFIRETDLRPPIYDPEDGVHRCPFCAFELESRWCSRCDRMVVSHEYGNFGIDFEAYGLGDAENDLDDGFESELSGEDPDLHGVLYGADLGSIAEEGEENLDPTRWRGGAWGDDPVSSAHGYFDDFIARGPRMLPVDEEAEDDDEDDDEQDSHDDEDDSEMGDFVVDDDAAITYDTDATDQAEDDSDNEWVPGRTRNRIYGTIDLASDTSEVNAEASAPVAPTRRARPVVVSSSPVADARRRRQVIDSSVSPPPTNRAPGGPPSGNTVDSSADDDDEDGGDVDNDDDDDDGPAGLQSRDNSVSERLSSNSQGWSSRDHNDESLPDLGMDVAEEYDEEDDYSSDRMSDGWPLITALNPTVLSPRSLTDNTGNIRLSAPTASSRGSNRPARRSGGSPLTAPSGSRPSNETSSGDHPDSQSSPGQTGLTRSHGSALAPSSAAPSSGRQSDTSTDPPSVASSVHTADSRTTVRDQFLQQLAAMADFEVTNARLSSDPRISTLLSQYSGGGGGVHTDGDAFAHLDQLGGVPFSRPRTANRSWTPIMPQSAAHLAFQPTSADQHGVSLRPHRGGHNRTDSTSSGGVASRTLEQRSTTPISPIPLAMHHRRVFSPAQPTASPAHALTDPYGRPQSRTNSRLNRRPSAASSSSSSGRRMAVPASGQAFASSQASQALRNLSVEDRNPFNMYSNPITRPVPSTQRLREQSSTATIRARGSVRAFRTQPPPIETRDRGQEQVLLLSHTRSGSTTSSSNNSGGPPSVSSSGHGHAHYVNVGGAGGYPRRLSRASLRSHMSSQRLLHQPSSQRLAPQPSTRLLRNPLTPNGGGAGLAVRSGSREGTRSLLGEEERNMRAAALVESRLRAISQAQGSGTNPFYGSGNSPFGISRSIIGSLADANGVAGGGGLSLGVGGAGTTGPGSSFQARLNRTAPTVGGELPMSRAVYVGVGRQEGVH